MPLSLCVCAAPVANIVVFCLRADTHDATPAASSIIPCVACTEIHPTAEQLAKTPADLKHGLILFAGDNEVMHLKSDVLIGDLVEEQIVAEQRRRDEQAAKKQAADAHATDLIPGVYEGKHHRAPRRQTHKQQPPPSLPPPSVEFAKWQRYYRNKSYAYFDVKIELTPADQCRPSADRFDGSHATTHQPRQQRGHCNDDDIKPQIKPSAKKAARSRCGRNELRHPWFNAEMAALIALRERAHRRWLASRRRSKTDDPRWEAFRRCRSAVSALRRTARDEYLAGAMGVDGRLRAPMPWQTKGILRLEEEGTEKR